MRVVGCADVLCALEECVPILCLRPRLEVVKGDVGKLTAERCAIDREADTVEPLVHPGAVLAHALADDVHRDPEIGERATGDTREDGADVLCALEERVPILCLRPRLEVVKGDVGELTAERCAIDREADTVEPLVHLGAVLTHALADDV